MNIKRYCVNIFVWQLWQYIKKQTGSLVQGYDSHLRCERSRVHIQEVIKRFRKYKKKKKQKKIYTETVFLSLFSFLLFLSLLRLLSSSKDVRGGGDSDYLYNITYEKDELGEGARGQLIIPALIIFPRIEYVIGPIDWKPQQQQILGLQIHRGNRKTNECLETSPEPGDKLQIQEHYENR